MNRTSNHRGASYECGGDRQGLSAPLTGWESGMARATAQCYALEGENVVISYLFKDSGAQANDLLVGQASVREDIDPGDVAKRQSMRS